MVEIKAILSTALVSHFKLHPVPFLTLVSLGTGKLAVNRLYVGLVRVLEVPSDDSFLTDRPIVSGPQERGPRMICARRVNLGKLPKFGVRSPRQFGRAHLSVRPKLPDVDIRPAVNHRPYKAPVCMAQILGKKSWAHRRWTTFPS